jgi:hypothetical protein
MGMHQDVVVVHLDVIQGNAIERQQYLRGKHGHFLPKNRFRVVCSIPYFLHREWH